MRLLRLVPLVVLLAGAAGLHAERVRPFVSLPDNYSVYDVARGPGGEIYLVGRVGLLIPDPASEDNRMDAFVTKLSADGREELWRREISGDHADTAWAVAVDGAGGVYVAVSTTSSDLQGTAGAWQPLKGAEGEQAFVLKLDADGDVIYQTYVGAAVATTAGAIAVDAAGRVAVTGVASGEGFPTTEGAAVSAEGRRTGFVTLLEADGSDAVLSARFVTDSRFGGASGFGAVAFGPNGELVFAGSTNGQTEAPTTTGAFQQGRQFQLCAGSGIVLLPCDYAYVTALNAAGTQVLYSTYLTGTFGSRITAIEVDPQGRVLAAGWSYSTDFPYANERRATVEPRALPPTPPIDPPPSNGFLAMLSAGGESLVYAARIGGEAGDDTVAAMHMGPRSIVVTGRAASVDFPGLDEPLRCLPASYVAEIPLTGAGFPAPEEARAALLDGVAVGVVRTEAGLLAAERHAVRGVDWERAPRRVACVNESATLERTERVAPGSLLSLFGRELAGETVAATVGEDGLLPTTLAGISVLVGGLPAPLLYVSPEQINLQVPFEVEPGRTVDIQWAHAAAASPGLVMEPSRAVAVEERAPAVFRTTHVEYFCADADPFLYNLATPDALALLEDGTVMSCGNLAPPGSVVTVFLSGVGRTEPARMTGATHQAGALGLEVASEQATVLSVEALEGAVSSVWVVRLQLPERAGGFESGLVVDGTASTGVGRIWAGP